MTAKIGLLEPKMDQLGTHGGRKQYSVKIPKDPSRQAPPQDPVPSSPPSENKEENKEEKKKRRKKRRDPRTWLW
jgi:hypothetical protein